MGEGIMVSAFIAVALYAGGYITLTSMIISVAMSVISTVMQQNAADEARSKQEAMNAQNAANAAAAAAREDAAKGTKLVISGEISALRVLYGRNLVGGIRVYSDTYSDFKTGALASGARGDIFKASTNLDSDLSGSKHEFLVTQQAICFGGIERCYAIDIDERRIDGEYVNEYNEVVYPADINNLPTGTTLMSPYTHGCKVNVYYDGNIADTLMTNNDIARTSATFTNIAYATCVYRLNRDEPQFSGSPSAQFYIEGLRVSGLVINGSNYYMTSTKSYSNNPALCLLDYLTNTVYGRGLAKVAVGDTYDVPELDLNSFHRAYLVCERVVRTDIAPEGKLWRGKTGNHSVKKFECNTSLESTNTIRSNVEILLDIMGDAQLVWSGGKYKLILEYPDVFDISTLYQQSNLVQYGSGVSTSIYECLQPVSGALPTNTTYFRSHIAANITDSDIVRDAATSISWPDSQIRLNFVTIKFMNESKDFKEDTVSWPLKTGAVYSTYLSEDSGELLENETFATGVTSYYNAMAKAEQMVRESRIKTTYEFVLGRQFIYLEPGDKLKVTSDVLGIPGELLNILSIRPDQNGLISVSAVKYDAMALAWNVVDTEVVPVRNVYTNDLPNVSIASMVFTDDGFNGYLTWSAADDNRIIGYQIITGQSPIEILSNPIGRGIVSSLRFDFSDYYSTSYYATVVPITSNNRKAPKDGWPIIEVPYTPPSTVTGLTANFTDVGTRVSWNAVNSPRISQYELRENGTTWENSDYICTVKTTEAQQPPLLVGSHIYRIKSIDTNGIYSTYEATYTKYINAPAAPELTSQIVDNNVMLLWTPSLSEQSIRSYEIRRGNLYASSDLIGEKSGLFTSVFETVGGTYKYWVEAIDIAGNHSTPTSVAATVAQPKDYALRNDIDSSLQDEAYIVMSDYNTSPQNGYVDLSYYNEVYCYTDFNMVDGSWHEEIFDIGEGSALDITSSAALATINTTVISDSPVMTVSISSSLNGSTWSTPSTNNPVALYHFRYVKVRLEVTGTGTIQLQGLDLKLSTTQVIESGNINCVSTDSGGTTVTFTKAFIDVFSITVNANATTPVIAIYDFTDTPNPTTFKILLFNTAGTRISGNASYQVIGII